MANESDNRGGGRTNKEGGANQGRNKQDDKNRGPGGSQNDRGQGQGRSEGSSR